MTEPTKDGMEKAAHRLGEIRTGLQKANRGIPYPRRDIISDLDFLMHKLDDAEHERQEERAPYFCAKHTPNPAKQYSGCLVCSRDEDYQRAESAERQLREERAIKEAEKKILLTEVEAHTETKRQLRELREVAKALLAEYLATLPRQLGPRVQGMTERT